MNFKKEDDFEIIDEESFSPEKETKFSHQQLVMKVMDKCLEAGCREMREGYFNIKQDKNGNMIKTYIEDTRKVFIECLETAEMIMICDFEDEKEKTCEKNIKELKKELETKYKELCELEDKDWEEIPSNIKQIRWSKGIYFRKGYLNTNLPFYQDYIEEQVRTSRDIFKELTKLTKKLNWYEEYDLIN